MSDTNVNIVPAPAAPQELDTLCKLCNSEFKTRAEEMFEENDNAKAVYRWLVTQGMQASYCAIKNHLYFHYRENTENESMAEYSKKLRKWKNVSKSDEALYARYIEMLDMEATTLISENSKLPLSERRKNDELLVKIAGMISTYKEQLRKVQTELKPVEVVITSLNKIIEVKMEGSPSEEVRKVLKDIINQLMKEIGDLPVTALKNSKENK